MQLCYRIIEMDVYNCLMFYFTKLIFDNDVGAKKNLPLKSFIGSKYHLKNPILMLYKLYILDLP